MPVYSSHSLRYEDRKLGGLIRVAREGQGLTLKQLGARVSTSAARLSQVENDRLRLDLQQVLRFADALQLPLSSLIPADASLPYQISRDSHTRQQPPNATMLVRGDGAAISPHAYTPLAELFVGRHLEPWLGRIAPLQEHQLQCCYPMRRNSPLRSEAGSNSASRLGRGVSRRTRPRRLCLFPLGSSSRHSIARGGCGREPPRVLLFVGLGHQQRRVGGASRDRGHRQWR